MNGALFSDCILFIRDKCFNGINKNATLLLCDRLKIATFFQENVRSVLLMKLFIIFVSVDRGENELLMLLSV